MEASEIFAITACGMAVAVTLGVLVYVIITTRRQK